MTSIIKKIFVLVTIVFLITLSFSTSSSALNKSLLTKNFLENEPAINITIPDANLHYHPLKIRYADVEFGEPGKTIDVNISGYSTDFMLRFIHNITLDGDLPLFGTWVIYNLIVWNETDPLVVGWGYASKVGNLEDWQMNLRIGRYGWNVTDVGTFSLDITLTGVPPRLQFLFLFHAVFDVYFIDSLFPTPPFQKIFGGQVNYELNIHK